MRALGRAFLSIFKAERWKSWAKVRVPRLTHCSNCDRLHELDLAWGNGWPVCSEACHAELQKRVDEWTS